MIERVLIADDNRDAMLTLGVLLRSEGYLVQLAQDGVEALTLAASFRPDVALINPVMPGCSGFDVARELLRHLHGDQSLPRLVEALDGAG